MKASRRISVRASDSDTATVTSTAIVADPAVQATGGFTIQATAGSDSGQQTVASFTDPAGSDGSDDYSATIAWGDGSSSAGTIVVDQSGGFNVVGSHQYGAAGDFTITVTVHHDSASDVSVQSQATVAHGREPIPGNLVQLADSLTRGAESYGDFITWAYQQFLNRSPDPSGLAGWVSSMQQGMTDEQVESHFLSAKEYIADHGGSDVNWVIGMYNDLLGRAPDSQGLAWWTSQIEAGVPEYTIALGFAASREREATVVENDYTKYLGRSASTDEVNSWVDAFERGARNEDVIAGFIGSPEYYNDANKGDGDRGTWVDHVFDDVLGRLPTDAELAGWLSQMDSPGYF